MGWNGTVMAQSLGLGSDRPRGIEREPARGGVKRRVGAPAANGGQAGRYSVQLKRRDRHRSGWGSNRGWRLRDTTMQLGGYGEGREMVTANQLGMPPDESRAPGEGHQQNQGDRRQTLVGDPFSLSGSVAAFGAVAAWRKPCWKAPCGVRSIQPWFSCFQRSWPEQERPGPATG